MPDSIREVLQSIAGGEGPSRDLAAGAYRRARSMSRRRLAAVAVAVIAGLAMAGGATAVIVDRGRVEEPPPAVDPTAYVTPSAPDPSEALATDPVPDEDEDADVGTGGCEAAWSGWGSSNSMRHLDELPDGLVFEVHSEGTAAGPAFVRFDGEVPSTVMADGEFAVAPDGNRFTIGSAEDCAGSVATLGGETFEGLPVFTEQCRPSWSPDSDRVVLNLAGAETTGVYLLDVATGKATFEVPDDVGCSPRWSADGKFLVSADGSFAVRPDGSERVELRGAGSWVSDESFTGVSSISADLSRACLQYDDAPTAGPDFVQADRCDRYVDTATGDQLEPPVSKPNPQVVFLADGGAIWCHAMYDQIELTLVDAGGQVVDTRTLPGQSSGGTFLRGYYVS